MVRVLGNVRDRFENAHEEIPRSQGSQTVPARHARREGEVHGCTMPRGNGRTGRSRMQGESLMSFRERNEFPILIRRISGKINETAILRIGDGLVRLVAVQCFLRQRNKIEDQAADGRSVVAVGMRLASRAASATPVSRPSGLYLRHGNGKG